MPKNALGNDDGDDGDDGDDDNNSNQGSSNSKTGDANDEEDTNKDDHKYYREKLAQVITGTCEVILIQS